MHKSSQEKFNVHEGTVSTSDEDGNTHLNEYKEYYYKSGVFVVISKGDLFYVETVVHAI